MNVSTLISVFSSLFIFVQSFSETSETTCPLSVCRSVSETIDLSTTISVLSRVWPISGTSGSVHLAPAEFLWFSSLSLSLFLVLVVVTRIPRSLTMSAPRTTKPRSKLAQLNTRRQSDHDHDHEDVESGGGDGAGGQSLSKQVGTPVQVQQQQQLVTRNVTTPLGTINLRPRKVMQTPVGSVDVDASSSTTKKKKKNANINKNKTTTTTTKSAQGQSSSAAAATTTADVVAAQEQDGGGGDDVDQQQQIVKLQQQQLEKEHLDLRAQLTEEQRKSDAFLALLSHLLNQVCLF